MPELIDPTMINTNQLILVENGIVEILDSLSANIFSSLVLEFHYTPIHPNDALLIKHGARYKCVSLMKKNKDLLVWLPSAMFKAMVSNPNPDRIYIKVATVLF